MPGPTWTEGVDKYMEEVAAQQSMTPAEGISRYFIKEEPASIIQRFIEVDEVAQAVVMTAANAAINGASVHALIRHLSADHRPATLPSVLESTGSAISALSIIAALITGLPGISQAQATQSSSVAAARPPEAERDTRRRALALTATFVPGLLLHGAGHFALGDRETALGLLATEGLGLGLLALGVVGLAITGASRRTVGPLTATTLSGFGLFTLSWSADLWAAVGVDADTSPLPRPAWQTELGYQHIYDPTADYGPFAAVAFEARRGRWRLRPSAWTALAGSGTRLRFELHRAVSDGPSRLAFGGAATHHREAGFSVSSGELTLRAHLPAEQLWAPLRGAFFEVEAGLGLELYDYRAARSGGETSELLLFRFTQGARFGPHVARLYYDHRHDDFVGGLKVPGLGSGIAGRFGLDVELWPTARWGARISAASGAAHHAGLSLLLREGPL